MIAIDLGSNTLRVLVYDCQTKKQIAEYEKVVKTADGLAQYGLINQEATRRVVEAIKEAQSKIDFKAHSLKAVTTEALRRASNAQEVQDAIYQQTGIDFEIISGEQEATFTSMAVKRRVMMLTQKEQSFVLVDIGGGSTELIFHYGKRRISRSFSVGIVTIAQTYETLSAIEEALPHEMQKMKTFTQEIYANYEKPDIFVATAGTPTTVAAMKLGLNYETYDCDRVNGTLLQTEELNFYLEKLLAFSFQEREKAVGTGRSDLIMAGILIYKALYRLLEFDYCMVIDDGLREGVALVGCLELDS